MERRRRRARGGRVLCGAVTLALAALGAGCAGQARASADAARTDRGAAARDTGAAPADPPDTTGQALWAYVTKADYTSWPLWPGKKPFFRGEEPHGALLTVYVDPAVYRALTRRDSVMPAGSIIVKENFGPDRKLRAHTIMYKVPGYSPEHRDWFWGQYAADGKVLAAGRVPMCWQCHDVAAHYDDLWILRDQEYLESVGSR